MEENETLICISLLTYVNNEDISVTGKTVMAINICIKHQHHRRQQQQQQQQQLQNTMYIFDYIPRPVISANKLSSIHLQHNYQV